MNRMVGVVLLSVLEGLAFGSNDPFVEDLLSRMTLEEKVGQCVQLSSAGAKRTSAKESRAADGASSHRP